MKADKRNVTSTSVSMETCLAGHCVAMDDIDRGRWGGAHSSLSLSLCVCINPLNTSVRLFLQDVTTTGFIYFTEGGIKRPAWHWWDDASEFTFFLVPERKWKGLRDGGERQTWVWLGGFSSSLPHNSVRCVIKTYSSMSSLPTSVTE